MKRSFLAAVASCLLATILPARTLVTVTDQTGFNGLDARIKSLILSGEREIEVRIQPGTYFFREEHLKLSGLQFPDLSIFISGSGARLVGEGKDYAPSWSWRGLSAVFEGPFQIENGYVELETGKNWDFRSEVRQARKRPEIVDRKSGLCRILTWESAMSAEEAKASWIILSQWFRSNCYKVTKIDGGYVYFRCPQLTDNGNALTDIDADYKYAKVLPRYLIYNQKSSETPYIREGKRLYFPSRVTLHECTSSRFLTVSGSNLKQLSVSGLEFFGNCGKESLLKFYRSGIERLSIADCVFDAIRGDAVVVQFTKGCILTGNEFRHCYRDCIAIGFEADDAQVIGNSFMDTGLMMDNSACVRNQATGTRIAENTFVDFSYAAVTSGIHYTESISDKCTVLIENNEMYQTAAFRKVPSRTLMDGGAIYISTVSQRQVIRNNYVHDIDGPADNRGIFLDDGAVNMEVYGNLVLGIANSYCIDSRRVRWVETHPNTKITRVNVNNYIGDNTVDGRIRFETRGGNDGCRKGPNTVLKSGYDREDTVRNWRKQR